MPSVVVPGLPVNGASLGCVVDAVLAGVAPCAVTAGAAPSQDRRHAPHLQLKPWFVDPHSNSLTHSRISSSPGSTSAARVSVIL